jgi:hypothetical protein
MTYETEKALSDQDIQHFMDKGYVVIKEAFTKEKAAWMLKDVWVRLGLNPNDKSSWPNRIHMPRQRSVLVSDFAPRAWKGICELIGGEERISEGGKYWSDSFIVNLGKSEFTESENPKHKADLDNWHIDGDFFLHFLDSPEQALLVIPIFSDEIGPNGGPTMIAPGAIPIVAKSLAESPEGVMPKVLNYSEIAHQCDEFLPMVGSAGDVVLMHPFMLHSASANTTRIPRFITNPPVSLKEPFRFDKPLEELSIIEQKTLKSIGKDAPYNFKRTAERRIFPGGRHDLWQRMFKEERERLQKFGTWGAFESIGVQKAPDVLK